jgi:hypothetical protein
MEAGEFRLQAKRKRMKEPLIDHAGRIRVWTEENYLLDDRFAKGDDRHIVLRSHCYRTEELTIAGSGKIDPKEITIGGINYRQLVPDAPRCELCETGDMIPLEDRFLSSTYKPIWPIWKRLWRRFRFVVGL